MYSTRDAIARVAFSTNTSSECVVAIRERVLLINCIVFVLYTTSLFLVIAFRLRIV